MSFYTMNWVPHTELACVKFTYGWRLYNVSGRNIYTFLRMEAGWGVSRLSDL